MAPNVRGHVVTRLVTGIDLVLGPDRAWPEPVSPATLSATLDLWLGTRDGAADA